MTPKIKNIIIFVVIAAVLILGYIFFIKPSPDQPALVSSSTSGLPVVPGVASIPGNATTVSNPQDFLTLLLSVKSIKLNDAILTDPAFIGLKDSSITLTPDGTEGRPNPFAPIGSDKATATVDTTSPAATTVPPPVSSPAPTNTTAPASPAGTSTTPAKTTAPSGSTAASSSSSSSTPPKNPVAPSGSTAN